MKLSIVIPCYNEEKNIPFIYNTLKNIINDNIEIILVNNGSTDNSQEVLESLCKIMILLKYVMFPLTKVMVMAYYKVLILQQVLFLPGHMLTYKQTLQIL